MYRFIYPLLALLTLAAGPASRAQTAADTELLSLTWKQILQQARGGEVTFFLWGGSDAINRYVSGYIGGILRDRHDITLWRVGIADTAAAVNIVLGEKQSGVTDSGAVDLIWINGENFRTMKQADLVFCGYQEKLPNNQLVNWDNPSIANDFGVPVAGCSTPWSKVQFAFAYDQARLSEPPRSMAELLAWIKANPGQFTYPAPPDFNGSVFVRHVFYHVAGGPDQLLGPFDQQKFDRVAEKTWALLNDLEPYLWRKGRTYPTSVQALEQLYANSEVALVFNYEPASVGVFIENGTFPPTSKGYGLTDGTIGNTNYTVIPFNSPNKAAALVVQNLLLSAEAQYEKARPEIWGAQPVIETARTEPQMQAKFAALKQHPAVVPSAELARNALPELQASWIAAIEKGWLANVGN